MTEFIRQCAEKDTLTKEDRQKLLDMAEEIRNSELDYLVVCGDLAYEKDANKILQAELQAYKDNLADGRMVELPCKVGDITYEIGNDCVDNPDHTKMCFCLGESCNKCEKSYKRIWEVKHNTADVRSIISNMGLCGEKGGFGKTVFLTLPEAEQALKEMEGK